MSGNKENTGSECRGAAEPLVSVVINCYNGERYLKEAIDSVFAQTYTNWEIVFWDNCSSDKSAEIARSYGERVRYFREDTTIPLGAARNKAMKQTLGEFVGFLDCDDVWLPEKLAIQVLAITSDNYALAYGGIVKINQSGKKIGLYVPRARSGDLFEVLLKQFDISVPTVLLRNAILGELGLEFDCRVHASEEYCLFMQLALKAKFCVIPTILAKYRIHAASLTNHKIEKWADEREYTLALLKRKNPGIELRYAAGFREAKARGNYYRARLILQRGDKASARSEMRKCAFVDWRYFVLYLTLFFPSIVWNGLHRNLSSNRDQ